MMHTSKGTLKGATYETYPSTGLKEAREVVTLWNPE